MTLALPQPSLLAIERLLMMRCLRCIHVLNCFCKEAQTMTMGWLLIEAPTLQPRMSLGAWLCMQLLEQKMLPCAPCWFRTARSSTTRSFARKSLKRRLSMRPSLSGFLA
jgi:hypothetical protein